MNKSKTLQLTAGQKVALLWLKQVGHTGLPHTTNPPHCRLWDEHKPATVQSFYSLRSKGLAQTKDGWLWHLTPEGIKAAELLSVNRTSFIAFDWCGFNSCYGRFTAMPGGETLLQQAWMNQTQWDDAQLKWFAQFNGNITVHRCLSGPYHETGDTLGTVNEIIDRLTKRLDTQTVKP